MNIPGIVQSALDGEEIETRVSLGGDDEIFVTPSSSVVYRAEGLLSDESIEVFPHDADRVSLSEGRRKTSITLEYPLDGPAEFTIPASKTNDVLQPVIVGILGENGIITADETVIKTYRFSELTLILTSDRLVKHIGEPVWDEDYEEYHFSDVTNLSFEDGSVATQIVLSVDGRPQRIKAPNDAANELQERLKRALFAYHDVDSLPELNEVVGESEEEDDSATADFGEGVDPLDGPSSEDEDRDEQGIPEAETVTTTQSADLLGDEHADSETQTSHYGHEPAMQASQLRDEPADARQSEPDGSEATSDIDGESSAPPEPSPEVLERLEHLEAVVERQNERLEAQQQLLEQLITELRQGR